MRKLTFLDPSDPLYVERLKGMACGME
jgi:hypothetical protein